MSLEVQKVNNMSSSGEESFHIKKLSSENYYHWKFDMKMLLIGKDLWEIVTGGEVLARGATNKAISEFRKHATRRYRSFA